MYMTQIIEQGNLLAKMDPCDVYEGIQLKFQSDGESFTPYFFDYQPERIAFEHTDFYTKAPNSLTGRTRV